MEGRQNIDRTWSRRNLGAISNSIQATLHRSAADRGKQDRSSAGLGGRRVAAELAFTREGQQ